MRRRNKQIKKKESTKNTENENTENTESELFMSSNSDVEQEIDRYEERIVRYEERITEHRAEIVAIKNGSGLYAGSTNERKLELIQLENNGILAFETAIHDLRIQSKGK